MKKLLGRTDMEDGLKRLDALSQKEARMASSQLLQATHPTDNRARIMVDKELDANVVSVSGGRDVRSIEATLSDKFAGVTLQQIAGQRKSPSSNLPSLIVGALCVLAVTQPHDLHLLNWLSPPDPSTNHHRAGTARYEGTAYWFLRGRTFTRWKSTMSRDSLLWVHGKRVSVFCPPTSTAHGLPHSRFRQKCPLVRFP
jgi:hypothetical protein